MALNFEHFYPTHNHHEHHEHLYFNKYSLNTFLAHISFLCYSIFHFYVLLETKDKNFINNKIIYRNKPQLKFLIKTKLKIIFQEHIFFRVFMVELMSLFIDHCYIHPIWSLMFAYYYFTCYKHNIYIRIGNFINILIVSYFVLINVSFIASLAIHCYLELFSITFNWFLYNNFEIKISYILAPNKKKLTNDESKVSNNNINSSNSSESNNSEFASKEEVEALLSNKKMD